MDSILILRTFSEVLEFWISICPDGIWFNNTDDNDSETEADLRTV